MVEELMLLVSERGMLNSKGLLQVRWARAWSGMDVCQSDMDSSMHVTE